MNSESSFLFAEQDALECPELWDWIKANCLHIEMGVQDHFWRVWMPFPTDQWGDPI